VLVSNAAFGATVTGVDDYTKKALHAGIDYSAWPLVTHTLAARTVFGRAPRYVVGVSSEGADSMHVGYDLIAAAKSVLETLCRYLHYRLRTEGTSVNVVRTRFVDTVSLADTFGEEFRPFVQRFEPDVLTAPEEVADAILGICSGAMDALGGQVLTVDRGAGLYENFSRLYQERDIHPIQSKEKP
jgi:NAD(P)-dependent dehydrogenase (short-subunit alcohol dehydrogenase family)